MRAVLVNGSPRKNMNTAKLLAEAERGAREAGTETEAFNLYDLVFTGCKGCMACRMKGTRFVARCALKDDPAPVLEKRVEVERLYGHCEDLWCYDTYQVGDYSRYDINMFSEEAKRKQLEEQYPLDLRAAREMGKRLVDMARARHLEPRPLK